jgi:L-lactate dehydrogenase (cytochrome)
VPYALAVFSGITVEQAAQIAPDVLWFQLYRFPNDDHKIGMDLVRRAEAVGVQALVLTFDTPARVSRPRELKSGIPTPFRLTWQMRLNALSSPAWLSALAQNGMPRFASLAPYMGDKVSLAESAAFIRREQGGTFTWDELARYRDKIKNTKLVVKGVLHPADAERLVGLGVDGMFVSNQGGRQLEALPASIDALPDIARAVGGKASIILDSGVRSGLDVARAIALGADAAFAGKAFLWSLGALGAQGPARYIDMLTEDMKATLGQTGCASVAELRQLVVRHPGACRVPDAAERA